MANEGQAWITGGAQGIGRGCVEHFLDAGWHFAALEADAKAIAELTESGQNMRCKPRSGPVAPTSSEGLRVPANWHGVRPATRRCSIRS